MEKEKKNLDVVLSFDSPEEIRKFISENESNIYTGKNVDGQDVMIRLDKGKGMIAETLNSKDWWEWNEYDEDGFVVGQGVTPSAEIEERVANRNNKNED